MQLEIVASKEVESEIRQTIAVQVFRWVVARLTASQLLKAIKRMKDGTLEHRMSLQLMLEEQVAALSEERAAALAAMSPETSSADAAELAEAATKLNELDRKLANAITAAAAAGQARLEADASHGVQVKELQEKLTELHDKFESRIKLLKIDHEKRLSVARQNLVSPSLSFPLTVSPSHTVFPSHCFSLTLFLCRRSDQMRKLKQNELLLYKKAFKSRSKSS